MNKFLLILSLIAPVLAHAQAERYPDDFWVTAEGVVNENGGFVFKQYRTRNCDLENAKASTLQMCQEDGAQECKVTKIYQHWCRTKCNCDS